MAKLITMFAAALCVAAQTPRTYMDQAKKTAGTEWAAAYNFFCVAPRANSADDPPIQPSKLFDNVYAVGDSGTVAYAITTSDGIMLIDALPANQTESRLLPGLQKLGLDPAKVKLVVVAHGHGDHFGGSAYLQEHYGARVAMSAADWDLLAAGAGKGKGPAGPKRDMVMTEGQPVVLGDEKVMPVLIPGHTPGSMGFIFPVKDRGKTHTAAIFGSTILTPQRANAAAKQQYLASIEHFREEAKKAKVDVELQNHPLMDGFTDKLAKLGGRTNPFIVGSDNYLKFLDVMSECMRAQAAQPAK